MDIAEPIFDLLKVSLLDLLYELRETDIRPILGGGYGRYLKQQYVRETSVRTLMKTFPQARSTNDLDLFLRTEVLATPDQLQRIADALNRLEYKVIDAARYYQFVKKVEGLIEPDGIKVDLLTRMPPSHYIETGQIRIRDGRRVKSGKEGIGLHARRTDEAVAIEDNPIEISVKGNRTTGEEHIASIFLPQAFAYAMMKLFAFRDQKDESGKKGYGRHHRHDDGRRV